MRNLLTGMIPVACYVAVSCVAVSCVDETYDLTEDIDLTVNVGGDLTLPSSNTDVLTLSHIFDLEENSSIREAEEGEFGLKAGDYVLVQQGDRVNSDFRIGNVQLSEPSKSTSVSEEMTFVYSGSGRLTSSVKPYYNVLEMKDGDVTREIVSVSRVFLQTDVKIIVGCESVTNFDGKLYIEEGYTIRFDDSWRLEVSGAESSFIELADHNVLRFKQRMALTAADPLTFTVRVVEVDLSGNPEEQGIYAPGHIRMKSEIESSGSVSIDNRGGSAVGSVEKLSVVTTTDLVSGVVTEITGIVNPEINIDETSFAISDIPEFLSDDENSLDVANPRFYLSMTNNSPVAVELNGRLSSYVGEDDATTIAEVGIGADYGTEAMIAEPGVTTSFLVSQLPVSVAGVKNITVPGLSSIMSTIPDLIKFDRIDCRAVQQPVTIELDPVYDFVTDHEVVMPLAFGPEMRLHYTHEDNGWDSEDMRKYNFNKAQLSIIAENTMPLDMAPQIVGINIDGEELDDVTATVEGVVAAGSPEAPASSTLNVVLESKAANLAKLDGIKLIFDATSPSNSSLVGVNLNSGQTLRFAEVKIKIIGGVTLDLND